MTFSEERRREEKERGDWEKETGGGGEKKEVERLLLSSSKSTVNNAGNYQGRQKKKGETGLWRTGEEGKEGGRRKEREEEGKHYSSVPSKHEMLGYFNKKEAVHMGEKEPPRNRGGEQAGGEAVRGEIWEMESESIKQQITSCCHEIGNKVVFFLRLHTYIRLSFGICLLLFGFTLRLQV